MIRIGGVCGKQIESNSGLQFFKKLFLQIQSDIFELFIRLNTFLLLR